jgi:hypothetical protein
MFAADRAMGWSSRISVKECGRAACEDSVLGTLLIGGEWACNGRVEDSALARKDYIASILKFFTSPALKGRKNK